MGQKEQIKTLQWNELHNYFHNFHKRLCYNSEKFAGIVKNMLMIVDTNVIYNKKLNSCKRFSPTFQIKIPPILKEFSG